MTDADDKTMSYSYDLSGNTAAITDRNGNISLFVYDNRNMLTEKLCVSASGSVGIEYGYDAAGNRISMQDESGSYTYKHDGNNRITEVRKDSAVQLIYTYDATGNIETVADSEGFVTGYTYDKSGRMETVTFDGRTTIYAYDLSGNRESVTYEGGVKEEYTYNRNNRLLTLTNKKPNGAIISKYSYTYDIIGNETSKTDNFGTTYYTYDKAGRVTKVETPGKTTLYTYDNAGNRQSLAETYTSNQSSGFVDGDTGEDIEYIIKTSRYFYSNTNHLMKLVEEMSDSSAKVLLEKTTEYLYDENGNELATSTSYLRPTGGTLKKSLRGSVHGENQPTEPDILIERTNNTFDGFNRLKAVEKIEDGTRTSVEYTYNGDDLRTQKVVKSSDNSYTPRATSFLYDRQHVLLETDATGEVQTRYIRGINYIAQYSSVGNGYSGGNEQELSYFLFNGHGDTVQTVTETGEIQNQYDYDIFGSPTLTIEIAACSIRYAGEYLDNETGLYYLRARYYDPYVGRFISEDSYWGEDTNPLSLNLYTYAYNNPERFIDPTGHRPTEAEIEIQRKIAQIDSLKRLWHEVENDSFVDYTSSKQDFQKMISDVATENKDKLIGLEQGKIDDISNIIGQMGHMNKDAYDFIKDYKTSEINTMISLIEADKKGVKGSWAAYKLIKSVEAIEYSKRIDNNVQAEIKDRAKEYFYAITGFDVYGITEAEIKQEIKTSAELFSEYYLSNQIQKVSFMNEETSPDYTPYDPIFNRWTLLDTFINAARTSHYGDKNPNDTRWMRKFYYENVWGNKLREILEDDQGFDPDQIDNNYWLVLMSNNFYNWLNDVANLKTKEALQAGYNWESGQFVVDIAVATFAAVIAAKATPVVLSLGKPVMELLSTISNTIPSLANDGGQLATTIGINLSSNAVTLNDVLVYAEAACMTQALTLEQAIMTMSGGNPEQLINMINAGSGYYSSAGGAPSGGRGPNPGGRLGGPAHRNKVEEIKKTYREQGFEVSVKEQKIVTPGGYKESRYGDIMVRDPNTGEKWIVQVGKQTKTGDPVVREIRAIIDLMYAGYYVEFVPYN